jgi:TRAP-type C4-dicarboxylate transport system substrate-binding protein
VYRLLILLTMTTALLSQILAAPGMVQADKGKPVQIKFATVAPEGSAWMKSMRDLDRTLREKSRGKIGFRLYAGGIAGDELDVLRKMRIGQIHCAAFSGVGFGQILPMVRILDLPFLFRSEEEIDRVHKELAGYFADAFLEKGFELLSWAEVGNALIYSKKSVQKVSDMAKCKIWSWSGDPIAKETFAVMGTTPNLLAITDVTTALNTGMIDTVYGPPLGVLALQWHANLKYMTTLPLAHSTGSILISKNFFNKIPLDLRRLVREELRKSMDLLTIELREQSKESVKIIESKGLKALPFPQGSELAEFYKVHDQVARHFAGDLYTQELLDRLYMILGR